MNASGWLSRLRRWLSGGRRPAAELFVFRETIKPGAPTVVGLIRRCDLPGGLEDPLLSGEFGGGLEYEDGSGQRLVGVWGRRKVARFVRRLRAEGACIVIRSRRPEAELRVRAMAHRT